MGETEALFVEDSSERESVLSVDSSLFSTHLAPTGAQLTLCSIADDSRSVGIFFFSIASFILVFGGVLKKKKSSESVARSSLLCIDDAESTFPGLCASNALMPLPLVGTVVAILFEQRKFSGPILSLLFMVAFL